MSENIIPLSEGAVLTANFRKLNEEILAEAYRDRGTLPRCETFSKSAFDALFANEEITGVRVYSAMDAADKVIFVICGVNSQNEDVYITREAATANEESFVIETGVRCPDYCPPASPLNEPI